MTARVRALARLLEAWDGQTEPPRGVEAVIRASGNRVTDATLDDLVGAVRQNLGDVPRALLALPTLDPEGIRRLSARLGELAHAFPRAPHLDVAAAQAVHGLCTLDRPRLICLLDEVESWMHGHMLLGPLPLGDAFRVAAATGSPHVRFAAIERVVRRENRPLTPDEEPALTDLLTALAGDDAGWPGWLAVCNRYPVRTRHMQEALGRALARVGDRALEAYVQSISLSTLGGEGRTAATNCLTVFRGHADAERRRTLWRSAFERWRAWDFDLDDRDGNLTEIATTELDYAVVGWLVEGLPLGAAFDPDAEFARGLHELDLEWHASVSVAVSSFFRLLSRYQISVHARGRSPGSNDWLPGPAIHVPPAAAEPFVQRRYHWAGG